MKIFRIRSNTTKVSNFVFNLRNKSYVRNNSLNKKKIQFLEHQKWFENFLKKKNILYIMYVGKFYIGYIRLEKLKKYSNVSWAVLKKYQKKGYAKKGLNFATKSKKINYKALIKKNNLKSISIAEKTGFKLKYSIKNICHYFKNNNSH